MGGHFVHLSGEDLLLPNPLPWRLQGFVLARGRGHMLRAEKCLWSPTKKENPEVRELNR